MALIHLIVYFNKFIKMEMKIQEKLWLNQCQLLEEQFCTYILLFFRSTNWDEVSKKDYERKDRPSPPKG